MAGIRKIESILLQIGESDGVESDSSLLTRLEEKLPELGMLSLSPPGVKNLRKHTIKIISRLPQDICLRWAGLYHDIGKPAVYVNQHGSQFSNHELTSASIFTSRAEMLGMSEVKTKAIAAMISLHMRVQQYNSSWNNRALRKLAEESYGQIEKVITLARADGMSYAKYKNLKERMKNWKT